MPTIYVGYRKDVSAIKKNVFLNTLKIKHVRYFRSMYRVAIEIIQIIVKYVRQNKTVFVKQM